METDDEATQLRYAGALAEWGDAGGYDLEVTWDVCCTAALGVPYEREERPMTFGRAALAGVCVGLAMLSHLEWGLLAATTLLWSRALGGIPVYLWITYRARKAATAPVSPATAPAVVIPNSPAGITDKAGHAS